MVMQDPIKHSKKSINSSYCLYW